MAPVMLAGHVIAKLEHEGQMTRKPPDGDGAARWIAAERADSFDEELEMELDDERLEKLLSEQPQPSHPGEIDRRFYFRELFRL